MVVARLPGQLEAFATVLDHLRARSIWVGSEGAAVRRRRTPDHVTVGPVERLAAFAVHFECDGLGFRAVPLEGPRIQVIRVVLVIPGMSPNVRNHSTILPS